MARPYRVLIFDDDEAIRKVLWALFDSRGYEVFTFPHPRACAICDTLSCLCPLSEACADIIISDLNMPSMKGIDFLERQIRKGCRCKHVALMSGDMTPDDARRAGEMGITLFTKPFLHSALTQWIEDVESSIPEGRKLSDWFVMNTMTQPNNERGRASP